MAFVCGALRSQDSNTYQPTHPSADGVYGAVNAATLPKKIDLREIFGNKVPIRDQKTDGACVAFAANTIAQQLELQDTSQLNENLSPRYTYLNRVNQDSEGMYPHNAMELLQKIGVVRERLVPYENPRFKTKEDIPQAAYVEGRDHRMGTAARVWTLDALKKSISERNAGAIITFQVYNFGKEFWKKHHDEESQGGHCVAIVGYKDPVTKADGTKKDGYFIIQNSWGTEWGEKGFSYYSYKDFKAGLHDEIWTFVDIKGSKPFKSAGPAREEQLVEVLPVPVPVPSPRARAARINNCVIL